MLLEGGVTALQRQPVAGKVSADGEEHGNPTSDALLWIGVTRLVEIKNLSPVAEPFRDNAAAFRHHPQAITSLGMDVFPVGIRR